MNRRALMVVLIGLFIVSSVGCRLCDRGRKPLFGRSRDFSSRENDRVRDLPQDRNIELNDKLPPIPGDDGLFREYQPSGRSGEGLNLPPPGFQRESNRFGEPSWSEKAEPKKSYQPKKELLMPDNFEPEPKPKSSSPQSRSGGGLLGDPVEVNRDNESTSSKIDLQNDQFSKVKANLANGRVPTLQGLDRLKSSGYRTVAFLHTPKADTSNLRRDVEAKGMRFVGIPVSPGQFNDSVRSFADVVNDRQLQPTFVCDEDGVRSGAMWYSYFRKNDYVNDETARLLAGPLGLNESLSGESGDFWVAIRNYFN